MTEDLNWKEYQEKVADFFRLLGAKAETNVPVKGARGTHNVDVLATFNLWGQKIIWICECKFWKTSIPKEKVLTLYQIAQDIGADRGFLFSENGFQSGAIKATNNTNIVLTSIEGIYEITKEDIFHTSLIQSLRKINFLKDLEKDMWIDDLLNPGVLKGIDLGDAAYLDGILMYLSLSIQKALDKKFPIVFSSFDEGTIECDSQESFLMNLKNELDKIESKINNLLITVNESKIEISKKRDEFVVSVRNLISAGEDALFPKNDLDPEELRLIAASRMKEVGEKAGGLKEVSRGSIKKELHETMKLLIDSIYLHLTFETIASDLWNDSKNEVLNKIESMQRLSNL